jgi:exodeoxyribonuclease VII large subunit
MQDFQPGSFEPNRPEREVFTVSRLNREARMLLERGLGVVWLEGEISNLSRPSSGHWYFSLKDSTAQVRCAMFRQRNLLVRFPVRDGQQVLVRGRVGIYEARGDFQVAVDHMEEAGEGALRRRFEELKRKLAAEGLFDEKHKQPLPRLPRRVGVITSPTGAALHDVLKILRRRFPAIPVLVYPVAVQGDAAPREIVQALELAGRRADCDVLILGRGGGSLEDLWAFNEEAVARAIFACPIPVICGIGHEVDFTIADFVADERAPTPSGAAERTVPDSAEWLRAMELAERRMGHCMVRRLRDRQALLQWRITSLDRVSPAARLRQHAQRLDELDVRLRRAMRSKLSTDRQQYSAVHALLLRASPAIRVQAARLRLDSMHRALRTAAGTSLSTARQRLALAARALHTVSPLATLDRGYAIVTDGSGHVIQAPVEDLVGTEVEARLAQGRLRATVTAVTPQAPTDQEKENP